jgi:hypothetical protein
MAVIFIFFDSSGTWTALTRSPNCSASRRLALVSSPLQFYRFSPDAPREPGISVYANGHPVDVLATDGNPFATFGCSGPVELELHLGVSIESVRVRPNRYAIHAEIRDKVVTLTAPGPMNLVVEIPGAADLYLWLNRLENEVPDPDDPTVRFFEAGQIHEIGELILESGTTLYLQGGAIVRGLIRATDGERIRIAGPGVFDGDNARHKRHVRSIEFVGCRDVVVENIAMIRPAGWMLAMIDCEDVSVDGTKEIGMILSSDGIDIVSSRRVTIRNCFLRNGDDCIAVKALPRNFSDPTLAADVEDVDVSGCTLISYRAGNAMEIGHELRCDRVQNVRFRDCDVLGKHQFGAVFSIHNGDHATVSDVLWENIRVEHHYDKLIDLRVMRSEWSRDAERGQIRDVTLRNIDVVNLPCNPGYTTSLIGGYDERHTVERVTFSEFRIDGTAVENADQLSLFTKRARDIRFESGSGIQP